MSRQLYVNGTALEQAKGAWFARDVGTFVRSAAARRSTEISYPRRHGETILPLGYESGGGVLRITCTDRHPITGEPGGFPQLVRNEDTVKTLFLLDNLVFRDVPYITANVGRVNTGLVLASPDSTEITPRLSEHKFAVLFSSPFWRDETAAVATLTTAASNAALAPLRGGSAPIPDPLFIRQGTGAAMTWIVTDTVTGKWVRWTGTLATTEWVRLDPLNMTATKVTSETWTGAGADVSGGLSVSPGGFDVHRNVLVTSNGGGKMSAKRSWF